VHTRGSVIQRVFSHDVYHCADVNQSLGMHGLPQINLWAGHEADLATTMSGE
jgi:hypothetical protein